MSDQSSIYIIRTANPDVELFSVKAKQLIEKCDILYGEAGILNELKPWLRPSCDLVAVNGKTAFIEKLNVAKKEQKIVVFIDYENASAAKKFITALEKEELDYEFLPVAGWEALRNEDGPLAGKRVVITRSQNQSSGWRSRLEHLGAEVLELPLIEVNDWCEPDVMSDVFAEIGSYEMIVFTSMNGVRSFFHFFFNKFKDIRCIGGVRIACIGPATAAEVERYKLQVDIVPEESVAESLADAILGWETIDNLRILVVTGNLNRDILVKKLESEGQAIVDTLQVYETKQTDLRKIPAAKDFQEKGADAILFASSSAVKSFVDQAQFLGLYSSAKKPITCSIGPSTSATMREHKIPVDIEPKVHSMTGLLSELVKKLG